MDLVKRVEELEYEVNLLRGETATVSSERHKILNAWHKTNNAIVELDFTDNGFTIQFDMTPDYLTYAGYATLPNLYGVGYHLVKLEYSKESPRVKLHFSAN